ncbi:MAG: 30S ribosome-binding factor RbfA [Thermoanaerobaculia bacterium]
MSRRTHRVEDLLREELSEILLRELHDPRARLVTLSAVTVSPDLEHAHVAVSLYGSEEERLAAVEALRHAGAFLRGRLARRLRDLRRIPQLAFDLDRGPEHAQRISDLLENLEHDDEST